MFGSLKVNSWVWRGKNWSNGNLKSRRTLNGTEQKTQQPELQSNQIKWLLVADGK